MENREASTVAVWSLALNTPNLDRLGRPRVFTRSLLVCHYLLEFQLLKQTLASAANSLGFCSLVSELTFARIRLLIFVHYYS